MIPTSTIAGTLVISNTPSAIRLAAISFSTEFLAPGTTTSPSSGPAWRTVMQHSPPAGSEFTGLSMLPPCCAALERSRGSGRTTQRCAADWSARATTCSAKQVAVRRHVSPAHRPFQRVRADASPSSDGQLVERTRYRLAIPWFGWLFALPVRALLGRRGQSPPTDRATDHTPWWAPPDQIDAAPSARARSAGGGVDVVGVHQHAVHPDRAVRGRRLRRRQLRVQRRRRRRPHRDHHLAAARLPRRPRRSPARHPHRRLGGADRHRPRRARADLPGRWWRRRRSAARSASRSTS